MPPALRPSIALPRSNTSFRESSAGVAAEGSLEPLNLLVWYLASGTQAHVRARLYPVANTAG
jgi:hypothetical protein